MNLPCRVAMAFSAALAGGCAPEPASNGKQSAPVATARAPAEIQHPVKESDLTVVTLTKDAEERLGIQVVAVEAKKLGRSRGLGGEILPPSGASAIVIAPFAGTLRPAPEGATTPVAGATVAALDVLFLLVPLITPEAKVTLAKARAAAIGAVEKARAELETGKVSLARSEQVLREKAGSLRAVDDAKARVLAAEAGLRAAMAEEDVLARAMTPDGEAFAPVPITAPVGGKIRVVNAAAGQAVMAGAPLLELAPLERLWVRVAVYAGDAGSVDIRKEASVRPLGRANDALSRAARPITGPPSADPVAATVDFYYELENEDGLLRPGERVRVTVPLLEEEDSLVVPRAALLHDARGSTWVYEQLEPHRYARRRVDVKRFWSAFAILEAGPRPGTHVVTDGAAELFGVEFGAGK